MAEGISGLVSQKTINKILELLSKEAYPCGRFYVEGEFALFFVQRKDSELDAIPILDRAVEKLKEQSHSPSPDS